jgi:hypothetical protein
MKKDAINEPASKFMHEILTAASLDTQEKPGQDAVSMEATTPFGPIRRAILRGVLFAIAFTPGCFAVEEMLGGINGRAVVPTLVAGFCSAFFIAALAAVELFAERWSPSLRRDLIAAALASVVGAIALVGAVIQFGYIVGLIEGRSLERAVRGATELTGDAFRHIGPLFGSFSAPLAPLVFTRLRKLGLPVQVAATVVGGFVLGIPFHVLASESGNHMNAVFAFLGAATVILPLAGALADAVERRIARWAAGEE